MKKRLFCLVFIAFLCFANCAFADSWRVFDNAGLFTAEETEEIEQAIFAFQRTTNFDFAVLTTTDYIGQDNWKSIADSFYDSEGFGFGHQASGMLYYIDMNQRIPYVSTCGEMIQLFDSDTLAAAHDACHPFLSTGKYKDAVLKMIESATNAFETYKKEGL